MEKSLGKVCVVRDRGCDSFDVATRQKLGPKSSWLDQKSLDSQMRRLLPEALDDSCLTKP